MGEIEALQGRLAACEQALRTRIVIEQAKGVLAERLHVSVDEAFDVLRHAARGSRTNLSSWPPGL